MNGVPVTRQSRGLASAAAQVESLRLHKKEGQAVPCPSYALEWAFARQRALRLGSGLTAGLRQTKVSHDEAL